MTSVDPGTSEPSIDPHSEATMDRITLPPPWQAVGTEAARTSMTWAHPSGVMATATTGYGERPELLVNLTAPTTLDGAVTVPGPVWVLDDEIPAHLWTAGLYGVVVMRPQPGALLAWEQVIGECRAADRGVQLLGHEVRMVPGTTRTSLWRGRPVSCVDEVAALLPAWLPEELIVDEAEELECHTPDAGILLDGQDWTSEIIAPARPGSHELAVQEVWGTTRLSVGWAPSAVDMLSARAAEILANSDPRTTGGARAWLVVLAAGLGRLPQDAINWADEAVENVMARPFGDEDHSDRLLTCCAAARIGRLLDDSDLRREATRRAGDLDPTLPGSFMTACLVGARPDPAVPIGVDPLVAAERDIWTGRVGREFSMADEAVWELGSYLPSVAGGSLYGRGRRVPAHRAAVAFAITALWPEGVLSGLGSVPVGVLRQRTLRRLMVSEHLDDADLGMLLC